MGKNVENPLFSPPELATLTATIMHVWFGPPVDVQGPLNHTNRHTSVPPEKSPALLPPVPTRELRRIRAYPAHARASAQRTKV